MLQFVGSTYGVVSPKLLGARDDLNILSDKLYSTTVNGPNAVMDNIYIKGKNMSVVEFAVGAATATKNSLWIMYISDSAAVTHPGLIFASALTFVDK